MNRKLLFCVALMVLSSCLPVTQAATRVLVLGGSQPYRGMSEEVSEEAFPPAAVAATLASILAGDSGVSQPVTVEAVDTSQTNAASGFTARTLMSWFYWPDTRTNTLALLRGGWDYVVMMEDPFVASSFPEYYLEGVLAISREATQAGSQPVLVMPWSSGGMALSKFGEMAYRVGDGVGIPVAPAGYAWNNVSPALQDAGIRPTPRGAYVTAATVYSRLFSRSATHSTYVPSGVPVSDRDVLADTAFATVQDAATNSHYSGSYRAPTHFVSPANKKRYLELADFNSSTESGLAGQWSPVFASAGIQGYRYTSTYQSFPDIGHVIDLCQSRFFWVADINRWMNYASFDYMDDNGGKTMIYGLDRVMYPIPNPEQETGAAYVTSSYMDQGEYFVPVRVLWARVRTAHPEFPWQPDGHHMSGQMLRGIATMMYTLLSGRCPVDDEPADKSSVAWQTWFCARTGYEIATQHATLNARVPGFKVLPRTATATNVTTTSAETLTVRFLYAPTATVTVAVSVDNTNAVVVSPQTLVFTPVNYATLQTVSIRAIPGANTGETATVNFNSSSADSVFAGLNDQWLYNVVRAIPEALAGVQLEPQSLTLAEDTPTLINLGVVGAVASNTVVVGPARGTFSPTNSLYMPSTNFHGADSFSYYVTVGGTVTVGSVSLTITNTGDAVALTTPTNGSSYAVVAQIPLSVGGYWAGGRVDYLADGTLIQSVSNSPWAGVWTNQVAGSYAVKAVAYDVSGLASTSAVASLVVTNVGGVWWTTNSGSWGGSSNWLAGLVPGGADRALFTEQDISGVVTVRLDGARSANRLVFGDATVVSAGLLMDSSAIGNPVVDPIGPQPDTWIVSDGGNSVNTLTLPGAGATIEVRDLGEMPGTLAGGPGDYLLKMDAGIVAAGSLTKEGAGTLWLTKTNQIDGGLTLKSAHGGVLVGNTGALGSGPVTLNENTWLGCQEGSGVNVTITNTVLLAGTANANYRIGPGMAASLTVSGNITGTNSTSGSALYLGGQGRDLMATGETLPLCKTYNTLGAGTFTLTGDVNLGTRTLNLLGNWPCTGGSTNKVLGGQISAGTLNYNHSASDGTSLTLIGGTAQLNLTGNLNFYSSYAAPLVIRDQAQVSVAGVLYGYYLTIQDQARITAAGIYGRNSDHNPSVTFLGGTSSVNVVRTSKAYFDGGFLVARVSTNTFLDIPTGVTNYTFAVNAGGMILDSAGLDIGIQRNLTHGSGTMDGGLRKLGAGTVTLNGTNTYNGPTVVEAGAILRARAASIPSGTALTVKSGALLDLGGTALTVSRFNGGGLVTNGALIIAGASTLSNEGAVVSGDLTATSGLWIEMSGAGPMLTVGGTATLGGPLTLTLSGAASFSNNLVLIRAAAISNSFASVVLPAGWELVYTPTEVLAILPASYLATPASVTASDGTFPDRVVVTWSPAERAGVYSIWRRLESFDFSGAEHIGESGTTNYTDTTIEPNRVHVYWVKAMSSTATSVVSAANSGYAAVGNTTNTAPYRESFEGYRTNEHLVGRNGWFASAPSALAISEAPSLIFPLAAYPGYFPIQTNHARVAVITEPLTNCVVGPVGTNTWVDMMLHLGGMDDPDPAVVKETQCSFFLGTNGHVRAGGYSLSGGTNCWIEFAHAPVLTSEWIRLSIQFDYHGAHPLCPARGWFQCYLNGRLLTNTVALTSPDGAGVGGGSWIPMAKTNVVRLSNVIWEGPSILDDLVVDTALPYGFAWTVHATAGANGGVFPGGDTLVWNGSNVTVTIQPNPYYSVQSVLVDGLHQGTSTQFVFVGVTNDHALAALFAENLATNGTPQWWLANYGYSNNWDAAAFGDDDHDGMLNWAECVAGTDPTNRGSVLAVSNAMASASGQVVLSWPSVATRVYAVERAMNLLAPFTPVTSNLPAQPPFNSYTDTVNGASLQFYRIRVDR